MSIRRLSALNFLLVLFLVLISIPTVRAEGIHIGPATFHPEVSLNWSYDDNYRYQEKNKEGAYYLNVDPSLGITYDRGRNKFSLNVRSPVRYFSRAQEKKTKFQETFYSTNMEIYLPRRSYIKVYDLFTSTKLSPFLTEERFTRSDRLENHARFTFGTSLGELLRFEGNYRNDFYKFKDRGNNIFPFSLNNRKVDDLRETVIFNFLPRDSLVFNYSYQTDKFENDPTRDSISWQYDFGLLHRFKKFLSWSGRMGFGKTVREGGVRDLKSSIFFQREVVPRSEDDTFTWGTAFDLKITDKTSMNFSISKSVTQVFSSVESGDSFSSENRSNSTNKGLSMFFDLKTSVTDRTDITLSGRRTVNTSSVQMGGDTIFNDFDLDINQKFFESMFLGFNVSYGLNEFRGQRSRFSSKSGTKDERWNAGGDLSFKIFKHTTMGISFDHQERRSIFGDFSKNITSLNMRISY